MIILCVTRTGDGSLFYPVQGRDVDMDYKHTRLFMITKFAKLLR